MSKILRKPASLVFIVITLVLVQFRGYYSDITGERRLQVTDWDALGYYVYLPAIFIYQDYTKYEWIHEIDSKYHVSGDNLYQLPLQENGNRVNKYLGGVAILQAPFFAIGHTIALSTDYPADGFSAPYQYAIAFGAIIWFLIGLFILYKVLRIFFSERVSAWTIAMLVLATNAVQFVAIKGGMSHAYIFTLYAMLLFATVQWHAKPSKLWALGIGLIIGLACISRPTELLMVLIPILWFGSNKDTRKAKWDLVRQHKHQILFLALGGLLGVAPQLIYWKQVTGSFIYDVGSAWDFIPPHFQVLFGWKQGSFIYTPITILFVLGMFLPNRKKYPFSQGLIWFGLLNLWVIMAWRDWDYGASYATRALVQSYPIYALALAMSFEQMFKWKYWRKKRYVGWGLALYLVGVNLFQTWQYIETVLHWNQMNRKYYAAIYLDRNPTPLDMSLLDTDEKFNPKHAASNSLGPYPPDESIKLGSNDSAVLMQGEVSHPHVTGGDPNQPEWLGVKARLNIPTGWWNSEMTVEIVSGGVKKYRSFRIANPIFKPGQTNEMEFYVKAPVPFEPYSFEIKLKSESPMETVIESFEVGRFQKK